jgi:hypothetical protein
MKTTVYRSDFTEAFRRIAVRRTHPRRSKVAKSPSQARVNRANPSQRQRPGFQIPFSKPNFTREIPPKNYFMLAFVALARFLAVPR